MLKARSLSMLAAGMLARALKRLFSFVVNSPVLAAKATSSSMCTVLEIPCKNKRFKFLSSVPDP
jgi:hypothetical protein